LAARHLKERLCEIRASASHWFLIENALRPIQFGRRELSKFFQDLMSDPGRLSALMRMCRPFHVVHAGFHEWLPEQGCLQPTPWQALAARRALAANRSVDRVNASRDVNRSVEARSPVTGIRRGSCGQKRGGSNSRNDEFAHCLFSTLRFGSPASEERLCGIRASASHWFLIKNALRQLQFGRREPAEFF
jgi:hypothetical protein